jgi:hypothetical protein
MLICYERKTLLNGWLILADKLKRIGSCKLIPRKTNDERDKTEYQFMFQQGFSYTQFPYHSICWNWKPGKRKQHES